MRAPSPRALLACSAALLVAFVIGVVLTRHPQSTTPATTTLPPAFAVADVQVEPGAFDARLTWKTDVDSTAVVNWGPVRMQPLLWARGQNLTKTEVNTPLAFRGFIT